MNKLILKPGREKSVMRRHPWLFSGGVDRVTGEPGPGETVEVLSSTGELLGVAAYSPSSQIRARMWDWGDRAIDDQFFHERIRSAVDLRNAMSLTSASNAFRLVHAEADGLPGVIADRYADTVVAQFLSAGAERWREAIADALMAIPGVARVWERSDAEVRKLEGLEERSGLMRGNVAPSRLTITEHGLTFAVVVEHGHKTGFYLDQRDNRPRMREFAGGKDVLDCFCYTGGFALNALAAGARSVTGIDSAPAALKLAGENAGLNGLNGATWLEADVFQALRRYRDESRRFDVIVLDPPKLAPTVKHAEKAARAYKDVNLLAFKLLRPGGVLMTYSCSGGIPAQLFQSIVAGAALDAGVDARIADWLHAAADHPVALAVPESEYLKGLVCRVRD